MSRGGVNVWIWPGLICVSESVPEESMSKHGRESFTSTAGVEIAVTSNESGAYGELEVPVGRLA